MTMTAPPKGTNAGTMRAAGSLQRVLPELVSVTLLAKQAHWNLTGPRFLPLHALTEELAADTRAWADRVAERATALGFAVDARPSSVAAAAGDFPSGWVRDTEVIAELGKLLEAAAETTRTGLVEVEADDAVAHDIFVEVLEGLEKYAWLLRSGRD